MKIEEMNIRLQIKRIKEKKKFCNFFKIDTYINGVL